MAQRCAVCTAALAVRQLHSWPRPRAFWALLLDTESRPWTCGNALVTSTGTVVPAIPACATGPNDNAPLRPPPPRPPPHHCTKAKGFGCYNGSTFLAPPHYQPQVPSTYGCARRHRSC